MFLPWDTALKLFAEKRKNKTNQKKTTKKKHEGVCYVIFKLGVMYRLEAAKPMVVYYLVLVNSSDSL